MAKRKTPARAASKASAPIGTASASSPQPPPLLSIGEASNYLRKTYGVRASVSKLSKGCMTKATAYKPDIPRHHKHGNCVYFARSDIDAWVRDRFGGGLINPWPE